MNEVENNTVYEAARIRMMLDNPVLYPNRAAFRNELKSRLPAEIERVPKEVLDSYKGDGRVAGEVYLATLIAITMSNENGAENGKQTFKPSYEECFEIAVEAVGDLNGLYRDIVLKRAANFFEVDKRELAELIPKAAVEDIMEVYR